MNVVWNHVFGRSGTLTFTDTSTVDNIENTYTEDMVDFTTHDLTKTLTNGVYDVALTMSENTPVSYLLTRECFG